MAMISDQGSFNATRDPTLRFSDRVQHYVKYRPGYPAALVELLVQECGLRPESVVADIGSGTGLLARLFLEYGNQVFAVEPNQEMRAAAERLLARNPRFASIAASAEASTLPSRSVDFVTVGQAFHWFHQEAAVGEFRRILRPGGWIVLVWNDRQTDTTPFLRGYEALLHRFSVDYRSVNHKRFGPEDFREVLGPGLRSAAFASVQVLDYDGLEGRLLSSSYAPAPGHPEHEPMLAALRVLFDKHAADGIVELRYTTQVYYCPVERDSTARAGWKSE